MISNESKLGQFFGGYFHQDWMLDHNSTREVIADFLKYAAQEDKQGVIDELLEFITAAKKLSDAELKDMLFVVGAYFSCNKERRPAREWLDAIARQLQES